MPVTVRRLGFEDAPFLITLRREALDNEPLAFLSSPADDLLSTLDSARAVLSRPDEQATYGAFRDQALVGMLGLVRLTKVKQRHKAVVVGMYVQPSSRRTGVGRALLDAVIQHARSWSIDQLRLSVTDTSIPAKHLYERVGFRLWGTEPRAIHWDGKFVSEHHLALTLGEAA